MNNFKKIFVFSILASAFVFYFGFYNPVHSGALDNVSGWAWGADAPSSNLSELGGMGWLNFNCTGDTPPCVYDYGVNIKGAGDIKCFSLSFNYLLIKFF